MFKKIMLGVNICLAIPYLLICFLPFLASGNAWFIAIMGLFFPFLFISQVLFSVFWMLNRTKWFILPLLLICISWQQISAVFAFNPSKEFMVIKPDESVRVMSWNVSRWDERNKEKRGGASYRRLMLDLIELQNADILCLQEFFECYSPEYFEENIPVLKKMGFTYHYFFPSSLVFEGKFQYGLAIFSRFPIAQSYGLNELPSIHSEGLAFADIKINNKIIRVYTTHLESPGIRAEDYTNEQNIIVSRSLVSKLKRSYSLRNRQASVLRREMNKSPYPSILCANLDDIPNSYAYFEAKGNLNDAFLKKGFGLGRTIRFISPTLRTDYIFLNKKFQVSQFTRLTVPYSDHFPLIVDFIFK